MVDAIMSTTTQSTPAITLYDLPVKPQDTRWESYSPYVLKVSRALRLLKLPYVIEGLDFSKVKQYNPVGQLPVLRMDDALIPDSTRILRRINGLTRDGLIRGLDATAAAEAWLWEELGDTTLYPFCLAARWREDDAWANLRRIVFGEVPAPLRGVIAGSVRRKVLKNLVMRDFTRAGLEACRARFSQTLDDLEVRSPQQAFWMGSDLPSVADLGLFASLHALRLPLAPWYATEIQNRPKLSAWLDRVEAATAQHIMPDSQAKAA